jgi:hypothetical protein
MVTSFRLTPRSCFWVAVAVIFLFWASSAVLLFYAKNDDWLITRYGGNTFIQTLDSTNNWQRLVMPRPGDKIRIVLNDRSTKKDERFWTYARDFSIAPIPLISKAGIEKKWWTSTKIEGGVKNTWVEHYHMEYFEPGPLGGKTVGGPQSATHVPSRSVEFVIADDPGNAWPPEGQSVAFTCSAGGYVEEVILKVFPASVDPRRIENAADKMFLPPTVASVIGALLCTLLFTVVLKVDNSGCYWRWHRR